MPEIVLHILDYTFVCFHTALIIFNLLGWVWRKTRRANFITLLLTGLSWSVLGYFYGWGYCPLTDWHFQVLERLGNYQLPNSYIHYLILRLTNIKINPQFIDILTLVLFLVAFVFSITVNFFTNRKHE